MKTLLFHLLLMVTALAGDTTLTTFSRVSTTTYEKSPVASRSAEAIFKQTDPAKAKSTDIYDNYWLAWQVSVPEEHIRKSAKPGAVIILKVWDLGGKHYPGWNSPIVEVFSGEKRLHCQRLEEIGWATDVWGDTFHEFSFCVSSRERHRLATTTNVYRLNPETMALEHDARFITREELQREAEFERKLALRNTESKAANSSAEEAKASPEGQRKDAEAPKPDSE